MRRSVLLAGAYVLVLLSLVLVAAGAGAWSEPVLVTGVPVLLVAGGGAYLVARTARRVHARQMHLLRIVRENHKRASVWNFRVSKVLGAAVAAPEPGKAAPRARSSRRDLIRAGTGLLAVAALALVSVVGDGELATTAFVLMWLALGTGLIGLLVAFVERSLQSRQDQLEHVVTENHKRASVWNFHVSKALGIDTSAAQDGEIRFRLASSDGGDAMQVRRHRGARTLVDSGLFDADHYSALVDGDFATELDAASHYLTENAPLGVPPSPFLDLRRLPDHIRASLRKGDVQPLTDHVLDDDILLSAREDPAAEARDALIAHARGVHQAARLSGPRTTAHWDEEAEASWLRELGTVTLGDLASVSVVMPVRDRETSVLTAIRSVQAQTHKNWRLLVVDDGSTDGTADVIAAEAASDDRITLIRGPGEGVSHARNRGLDMAEGEYLAFLDSDNEWVPTYLEAMLRGMVRGDLGAAYAAASLRREDETIYRAYQGGLADLLMFNHIDLNVLMVRADVASRAGRFDEALRRWVDHDYAIKVATIVEPVLLPFIGCRYDDSTSADDRITLRESGHWQWAVLGRHRVRWDEAAETLPGRVSVVIPTYNDCVMTTTAVRAVLDDADRYALDVEVIVVDNGSRLEVGQALLREFATESRVRYQRLPRNMNFAIGCNIGLVLATGEFTLFLNNDTEVRAGVLRRLIAAMDQPEVIGAQPLLVYGDETIQTAGTVFTVRDGLPNHMLVGHPTADARPLAGEAFPAASAAALLMRTRQVREICGFDPIYVNGMEDVDLCLRGRDALGGHFVVVPEAIVTHFESRTPGRGAAVLENRRIFLERWRGRLPEPQTDLIRWSGFELAAVGTDGRDVPGPKPILIRARDDERLRWGVKISSAGGSSGDHWGDTFFAESLRKALVGLGHSAVVHRDGAHSSYAAAYDDVALVIRGLYRTRPIPGKINILWVISHPEDVTVDEVREFDAVFAASTAWSHEMTVRSGVPVVPMLQATDPALFHEEVRPETVTGPLFVGSTHDGRSRRAVELAVAAGTPLRVYGRGWSDQLPDHMLAGTHIDNKDLAGYYRGASRVVADHWDEMADQGFIQNRVFDAVATGSRVVSDRVQGVEELFGGAVRVYETPEELAYLLSSDSDGEFPEPDELRRIAGRVRGEHSFTARAQVMECTVSEIRKAWRARERDAPDVIEVSGAR